MNTIVLVVVLAAILLVIAAVNAAKAVPELPPEFKLTPEQMRESWRHVNWVLNAVNGKQKLVTLAHEAGNFPLSKQLHAGTLTFDRLTCVSNKNIPYGQFTGLGMVLVDNKGKEHVYGMSIFKDSYGYLLIRLTNACREV